MMVAQSMVFNLFLKNLRSMTYFKFSTKSDTETLLALYLNYGEKMFDLIDGMFAFAVLDRKKNCIFLARDRAGKKPLYYTVTNNSFIFASELNAMQAAGVAGRPRHEEMIRRDKISPKFLLSPTGNGRKTLAHAKSVASFRFTPPEAGRRL